MSPCVDITKELLCVKGCGITELPSGLQGDMSVTKIDCSGGWVIGYETALNALRNRLKSYEVSASTLPHKTKKHLIENCPQTIIDNLTSIFEGYYVNKDCKCPGGIMERMTEQQMELVIEASLMGKTIMQQKYGSGKIEEKTDIFWDFENYYYFVKDCKCQEK